MTDASKRAANRTSSAASERSFAPDDVPVRGVIFAAMGLFGGIMAAAAVVAALLTLFDIWPGSPVQTDHFGSSGAEPPRLEISPQENRMAIEASARAKLSGYAWVDAAHTRARIPIGRAMEKLEQQGWPDRPDEAQAP